MKLTKKLETEILKVYNTYCKAIIEGDVPTMSACVDDSFQIIGSAEGEVFLNKKDAMKFYYATADQIAGKIELRNRKIITTPIDDLIYINETNDMYVLIDQEWVFYSKFRLTSLLQKIKNTWKFVQVHASVPDSKTEEGEQLALKKIQKENLELREAVKRRTTELEQKNRELEIEASLERVRAVVLKMKKQDDLMDVARAFLKELNHLGFTGIRNTQIDILNDEKKTFLNYLHSDYGVSGITENSYDSSPVNRKFINDVKSAADALFLMEIKGKELDKWIEQRRKTNSLDDPVLERINALYFYSYSIGTGAVGISTFEPIDDRKLEIIKRFRNVFFLSYRRFQDIVLAEKQAREAQIEAALERIRSLALGMRNSGEVGNVTDRLFEELNKLTLKVIGCTIVVIDESRDTWETWRARTKLAVKPFENASYKRTMQLLKKHLPKWFPVFNEALGAREKYLIEEMPKKKRTHLLNSIAEQYNYTEKEKSRLLKITPDKITAHFLFFKLGYLALISEKKLPEENLAVAGRFVEVFDFAYTRFLDIKNAEEQAREAEIQLALERVRARTMAMQHSDELAEAASLLFKQISRLGTTTWSSGFHIWHPDGISSTAWMSAPDGSILTPFTLAYDKDLFFKKIFKARQGGKDFFVMEMGGKQLAEHYRYMLSDPNNRRWFENAKVLGFQIPKFQITHCAFFPQGYLMFISYEPCPEMWDIFRRFAKVFQQTYTRFLDLKKAEEQTREAQIQTSLERVRASAMAMHKSEELLDVCEKMFKEFLSLGFDEIRNAIINIHNDTDNSFINYDYAEAAGRSVNRFTNNVLPFVSKMMKISHSANDAFSETHISGKTLAKFRDLRKQTGQKDEPRLNKTKSLYFYFYSIGVGAIGISTYGPINTDKRTLLKRFRDVFNLSYKRYIDISKAEAQARESEIQLALERVRARTMAMQQSDELKDAAALLFQQVQKLGVKPWSCGYCIWKSDKSAVTAWMSPPQGGVQPPFNLPMTENKIMIRTLNAYKRGEKFYMEEVSGKEMEEQWMYLSTLPGFQDLIDNSKNAGFSLPTFEVHHVAFFEYGYLLFITLEPCPEAYDIFKRFAQVFEQTYTRFLDLKKAEAQAREAQIEAALEKVRSRSLAMHKSEEVQEVVAVVVQKLMELGVVLDAGGVIICTYFKDSKDVMQWIASPDFSYSGSYLLPYFDHPVFNESWDFKNSGVEYSSRDYSYEEKKSFFEYAFDHSDFKNFPDEFKKWVFEQKHYSLSFAWAKNSAILIPSHTGILPSEEDKEILIRFARVFEQAYIRFMDLQRAEAQAREAEIQLALERVRARTMAMHNSDELAETAGVLFQQLVALGITPKRCFIGIIDKDKKSEDVYLTSNEGKVIPGTDSVPMTEQKYLKEVYNAWKNKKEHLSYRLQGQQRVDWTTYIMNKAKLSLPEYTPGKLNLEQVQNEPAVFNYFFFSKGYIGLHTVENITKTEVSMLKRFSAVFEQTYTRFLDLQKAEAQAREAEIQLALERVRARTMAMQKSEELLDAASLLFHQVKELGCEAFSCGFVLLDKNKSDGEFFMSAEGKFQPSVFIPNSDESAERNMFLHWVKGAKLYTEDAEGEELVKHFEYLMSLPGKTGETFRAMKKAGIQFPEWQRWHAAYFFQGYLLFITKEPFEETGLFPRFASVFEQTYTRFLDLQKAEAQAREAEIETALERVRSRSMAMHKSDEIAAVASVLFHQLQQLNIPSLRRCLIGIVDESNETLQSWYTSMQGDSSHKIITYPISGHPVIEAKIKSWRERKPFSIELIGKKMEDFLQYTMSHGFELPKGEVAATYMIQNHAPFKYGYLEVATHKPISDDDFELLQRFASVFEQTYTRFLDLKKAESQAREAEIQLALERVRARTMAMHKSEELSETVAVLFQQFKELGSTPERMNICNFNEESGLLEVWSTEQGGKQINHSFNASLKEPTTIAKTYAGWKQGKKSMIVDLTGKELSDWIRYLKKEIKLPFREELRHKRRVHTIAFFSNGMLLISTPEPVSENTINLLEQFASVFNLTYRRFLDLHKAEAQAREAEIQLALERVRARTMAMQHSNELSETASIFFKQMSSLGIETNRLYIGLFNDDSGIMEAWATTEDGSTVSSEFFLDSKKNYSVKKMYEGWKGQKKSISIDMQGKELLDYIRYISDVVHVPVTTGYSQHRRVQDIAYFSKGLIGLASPEPQPEENINLLERFAKVFDQTYTRFLDLQKAEAQAREAEIELALERVRARTMAMQKSEELKDVIQLVYEQFINLNIQIEHTGFIIDYKARDDLHIWLADQHMVPSEITIPCFDSPPNNTIKEAKEKGKDFFKYHLSFEEKNKFYQDLFKFIPDVPEESLEYYFNCPGLAGSGVLLENIGLYIENFSGTPYTDEENNALMRFGKVFQQTYTRFLDLQKAEVQAREAKIEAALERVRSRTMGMQRSNELQDAATVLFQQVEALGVPAFASGFNIWDDDRKAATAWMGGKDRIQPPFKTSCSEDIFLRIYEAAENGESLFVEEQAGEALKTHYEYMISIPTFKEIADKMAKSGQSFPTFQIIHCAFFSHGYLMFISFEPVPSAYDIFKRFAKVFEQTYTRFLDLQKAEAQAREAQIEAALERVRSRTMGMQHSSELQDASDLLFQQVLDLGVPAFSCGYNIWKKGEKECTAWMSDPSGGGINPAFKIPLTDDPNFIRFRESKEKKEEFYVLEMRGERMQEHYQYLRKTIPVFDEAFKKVEAAGLTLPETQIHHLVNFDHGNVMFITLEPCPEAHDIFKRFGKVFEQTYTRFLDLKKAEEQAREAQIEAALEKVRSRSLAMHSTNELGDVVTVIVEKLKELGAVLDANGVVLCTYFPDSKDVLHWIVSPDFSFTGSYLLPYFVHPIFNDAWQSKESGDEYFSKAYTVEEKNSFFEYAFEHSDYKLFPDEFKQWIFQNDKHILSFAWQKNSAILIPSHTGVVPSEDDVAILKRFAKVFEQSYVRFLDLQKAEIQAREAQIEAALEKVRARAMAMHSSEDLAAAVNVFFKELKTLDLIPRRCGVGIINETMHTAYNMTTTATSQGDSFEVTGEVDLTSHPLLINVFNNWKIQKEYFPVLNASEMKEYYRVLKPQVAVTDFQDDVQYGYYLPFKEGIFYVWTDKDLQEEKLRIFRKFTSVIGLTYRRYLDLKEAEARTFEAIKQASLDRIRAEIASMRTSEDLNRITPIVWRELKTHEVPFIRCGVFIIDEEQAMTRVYLTTPDGKSLGVLNLSFDANDLTRNTVEYWRKNEIYREYWDKQTFINWTKSMMELGQVQNAETYQGSSAPPESLHLHFVPFAQGMLYVGDVSPLTDEKLDLVKTLAEAFSIAYARYEDFNNLEEAKNKIELTFNELKSAQAQLIHAEKLASLGELTAGIAHEIKNPLNFVNNFSDLSKELLDEIKAELENDNKEEILAILEDLKLNLDKINQHGKRADSIVKGMLLHSRGTSGEKTLTDINELLDQYVNLAYHGMRAQNKEFNITIEKDYDETLEKINVVPQDISRVFLNIINNACYAAYERKKKSSDNNFSPTLKVSTKKLNDKMEIRISDNGNGIPANILDKIFQPFFTTKPTGEGTGLGLSLSYDIVTKVHGGELKVETKEGEGTEFIIQLPPI